MTFKAECVGNSWSVSWHRGGFVGSQKSAQEIASFMNFAKRFYRKDDWAHLSYERIKRDKTTQEAYSKQC